MRCPDVCMVLLLMSLQATIATSETEFSAAEHRNSSFRTMFNLSLKDCRNECAARPSCVSVNYFRYSGSCDLNKMATGSRGATGKSKRRVPGYVHTKKSDWTDTTPASCVCANGQKCATNGRCVFAECEKPANHRKANMLALGAKSDGGVHCLSDLLAVHSFGAGIEPATFPYSIQTCSSDGSWKTTSPPGGPCHVIVFTMVPGTNKDPYIEWKDGTSSPDEPSWSKPYRSPMIDTWDDLPITEVRLSVFKHLKEVKYVVFNGTGSTNMDWFSGSRVMNSSWQDLLTLANRSSDTCIDANQCGYYFSLVGNAYDNGSWRRFFINKYYNGCWGDTGWFVATMNIRWCSWERPNETGPILVYSRLDEASAYEQMYEVADYAYITLCIGHCGRVIAE